MKIKRRLCCILGASMLIQPIYTSTVFANNNNNSISICQYTEQSQTLDFYEVDEVADFLERYFSSLMEIEKNKITNEYDQYIVFEKHGIDISELLENNYYMARSGKDCAWAVTKALTKIGLIATAGYALGQFKVIADALGSVSEAAYFVALAIKDGNLKSYLNGLVPSAKIDILVSTALGIAGSVTGISEVKKQCF